MLTCVICGQTAEGIVRPRATSCGMNQTCRSPECRATLMLHPDLADPERVGSQKPKGRWKPRERKPLITLLAEHRVGLLNDDLDRLTESGVELLATTEWSSDDWGTMDDQRGAGRPDAQAEIWSWLGRRSVLLKAIGRKEGAASITIRKTKYDHVQSILKRALGLKHPDLCEVFYAWRCPCQEDHRVEYDTLNDIPSQVGYHNPCPRCGASPLEVISDHE